MVYEDELIKQDELKVGSVYRKRLLDLYVQKYNCVLAIPSLPANVIMSDKNSNYEVKQILDNYSIVIHCSDSVKHKDFKQIIIIERTD